MFFSLHIVNVLVFNAGVSGVIDVRWFTEDTFQFLADLAENNDRTWFHANKKRYEVVCKTPMKSFAAEMIGRMQTLDPQISMTPSDAVFRIHRDTRFAKDKAPYKTNLAMLITRGEKSHHAAPGLYFNVESKGFAIASGCYMLESGPLLAIRRAIAANGEEFARLISAPEFVKHFGDVKGDRNKVLPPELKAAAVEQPLIFNKQFFYWAEHDKEMAFRDDLPDLVMAHIQAAWPLNEFFMRAMS